MPNVRDVPPPDLPSENRRNRRFQERGRQLARHRRSLGISQFELAIKVGLHPQTISRLERGQGSEETLVEIASQIGLELAEAS